MEDDAERPEFGGVGPEDAQEKLSRLEREIERLRKELGGEESSEPASESPSIEAREPEEFDPPPDPETAAQTESLLKRAQLARIRKQPGVASKLLAEAKELAPRSPLVLEAIGDDYFERKMYKGASTAYGEALSADPGNAVLERKHADAVYYAEAAGIGLELADAQPIASPWARTVLAALLPGVSQIVAEQWVKGSLIMGGFVGSLIITGLVKSSTSKGQGDSKYLFIAPLVLAIAFWLWGLLDAGAGQREAPGRARAQRPKPPVDLPFE